MNEDKVVYKLKKDVDLNKLADLQYEIAPLPDGTVVLFKFVPQAIDSELPQKMIEQVYGDKKWRSIFYKKHRSELKKTLGLSYDKNGKIIMTEKMKATLTLWRIQIEPYDDGWLGLKSADNFDKSIFYGKKIFDRYCKEEVDKLLELDLIEEFDTSNEE